MLQEQRCAGLPSGRQGWAPPQREWGKKRTRDGGAEVPRAYAASVEVHKLPGLSARPQSAGPHRPQAGRHTAQDETSREQGEATTPSTAWSNLIPVKKKRPRSAGVSRGGAPGQAGASGGRTALHSLLPTFVRYVEELKLTQDDVHSLGFDPMTRMPYGMQEAEGVPVCPPAVLSQVAGVVDRLASARQATLEVLSAVSSRDVLFDELVASETAGDSQAMSRRLAPLLKGDASTAAAAKKIDDWKAQFRRIAVPRPFQFRGRDYEKALHQQEKAVARLAASLRQPCGGGETQPQEPPAASSIRSVRSGHGAGWARHSPIPQTPLTPGGDEAASPLAGPAGPAAAAAPQDSVEELKATVPMQGEPEDVRDVEGEDRRWAAALKVQSVYRMMLAQKRATYMRLVVDAVQRIQSIVRMQIAKRRVLWVRRLNIYATQIQRMWRGWLARSKLHRCEYLNTCASKVQSCYRGYMARKRLRAYIQDHRILKKAAVRISHFWNEHLERQRQLLYERQRKAASVIAAVYKWYRAKSKRRASHHGVTLQSPDASAAPPESPAETLWQGTVSLSYNDPDAQSDLPSEGLSPARRTSRVKSQMPVICGSGEALFGLAAREVLSQPRRSRIAAELQPEPQAVPRFSKVSYSSPASSDPPVKVLYTAPFIDEVSAGDWLVLPPCPVDPPSRLPPLPERVPTPAERLTLCEVRVPPPLARPLRQVSESNALSPYAVLVQSFARGVISSQVCSSLRRGDAHHLRRSSCGRILCGTDITPQSVPRTRTSAISFVPIDFAAGSRRPSSQPESVAPPDSPSYAATEAREHRLEHVLREAEALQEAQQAAHASVVVAFALARAAVQRCCCRAEMRLKVLREGAKRRRCGALRIQAWWRAVVLPTLRCDASARGLAAVEEQANELDADVAECLRQKGAVACIERFWKRQRSIRELHDGYIKRVVESEENLCQVMRIQRWWKWMYAYKINNPYKEAAVRARMKRELVALKLRRELEQESAAVIQTVWHSFLHRKRTTDIAAITQPAKLRSELRLASAVIIQRFYRQVTTRARLVSALEQRRRNLVALTSQELFVEKITTIQAVFRGFLTRKTLKSSYAKQDLVRHRAAIKIQKTVRGYTVCRWYSSFHKMQEKALRDHMAQLRKDLLQGWPNDFPYPLN